ncbi:MAG: DNA polymerase, partial [Terracidiphilus sp.]
MKMATAPIPASPSPPPGWPQASFPAWPHDLESPEPPPAPPREPDSGPCLNWLFVDLNSYFASCEQQDRPELRGRPVAVVPMMADTTCCIAASYEAKAFGVKTGTIVGDAKRMCPGLELIEARHELYVDYHHRIVEAVESCLPVTAVLSIDEMACRLMGRERPLLAALDLGSKVKARIREKVGPMLRSSVGLATNRYLAKVASDMEKPDGLVALPLDILAEALSQLTLRDLPGIGARTEKRLNAKGIHTMLDLQALGCEQAGQLWGSVWGERLWHWLHGEDFDMAETEHLKSISHSHVLAPEMRTAEKAWAVAHKLLHKAAMRLRSGGLWASSIGLAVGFAVPRSEKAPVSRFGVPTRGWHGEIRLSECQDNQTLIGALCRLWASRPAGAEYDQPYFIGIQLNGLVPERLHSLNL